MIWIRRVLAAPLLPVSLICLIGAGKNFAGRLPDSSTGTGVMSVPFAARRGSRSVLSAPPRQTNSVRKSRDQRPG